MSSYGGTIILHSELLYHANPIACDSKFATFKLWRAHLETKRICYKHPDAGHYIGTPLEIVCLHLIIVKCDQEEGLDIDSNF